MPTKSENVKAFTANNFAFIGLDPITKIELSATGISIHKQRSFRRKIKIYLWNEIEKIELHRVPNFVASRPGALKSEALYLYLFTASGTLKLNLTEDGPFENPQQILKLLKENFQKEILTVQYTSLINNHPIIYLALVAVAIIAPIVSGLSVTKTESMIGIAGVILLTIIFCFRYRQK